MKIISALLLSCAVSTAAAHNVSDFGAVGDGNADDTNAILTAIADSKDGLVLFPKGNFRITRTIEIALDQRGFTSITGQGGVGRVTMAGPGPAFRFIGTHRCLA